MLSLDPKIVGGKGLKTTVGEIRKIMQEDLGSTGLTVQLAGVPTMQLEIRNAVERDTLLYNTIGFAAGCLIAIAFFRRISFMIIAAAPPLIAILLSLGALGWLNFSLNMFLNVMTPLIMVISFSDSMQLTFAARDRLIAGKDKYTAFREAVLVVGPACVLTHGTAGISFIALQFSSSEAIRTFGEAGLMATVIALLAVLSLVPLLGVLLIRKETNFAVGGRGADIGVEGLRSFCRWVALRMVSHPGLYSLIGLLVVVGLVGHLHQPRAALSAGRPGAGQAAGGRGLGPARRQAHRRQSDRRADRVPEGREPLRRPDARHHPRGPLDRRDAGRRRQRLVARIHCGAGSPRRPARPISRR